jgi:ATP-dependent DNA ligase
MPATAAGRALMAAVEQLDLEGIVAKRKADPYLRDAHWWKIKNPAYSQAEGRHELFNGGERATWRR